MCIFVAHELKTLVHEARNFMHFSLTATHFFSLFMCLFFNIIFLSFLPLSPCFMSSLVSRLLRSFWLYLLLLSFFPSISSSQVNQHASICSRSLCVTWSAVASKDPSSPLWSTRCWRPRPPPWCLLLPSSPPHTRFPCPAWRSKR